MSERPQVIGFKLVPVRDGEVHEIEEGQYISKEVLQLALKEAWGPIFEVAAHGSESHHRDVLLYGISRLRLTMGFVERFCRSETEASDERS